MADKGTILQLKSRIDEILDNTRPSNSITPQEHNQLLKDLVDTLFTTYGTVVGTDTYSVNLNITQTALQEGKLHLLSFTNSNTGPSTLNIDSLGAKNITKENNLPLQSDDIISGKIYEIRYYELTDNYRIQL